MVREAIGGELPKERKKTERPRWNLRPAIHFIDAILEADRKARRKQRHTAHRMWERLHIELPDCKICERRVRRYVHKRKLELGLMERETCVPQRYGWGAEAQIDFHEPRPSVNDFLRFFSYRAPLWFYSRPDFHSHSYGNH
jgi:hypothetical protein